MPHSVNRFAICLADKLLEFLLVRVLDLLADIISNCVHLCDIHFCIFISLYSCTTMAAFNASLLLPGWSNTSQGSSSAAKQVGAKTTPPLHGM
jgi:hypothetical protein